MLAAEPRREQGRTDSDRAGGGTSHTGQEETADALGRIHHSILVPVSKGERVPRFWLLHRGGFAVEESVYDRARTSGGPPRLA